MAGIAWAAGVSAGDPIIGDYVATEPGSHASAHLSDETGHVIGQYTDAEGQRYVLNGRQVGVGAQGLLEGADGAAFFRLEPVPSGLRFVFIPADAAGQPDIARAHTMALRPANADLRPRVEPPAAPPAAPSPAESAPAPRPRPIQ